MEFTISYADTLKKRLKNDIKALPVLPTGHYVLQVVGEGRILDNKSDNEKAPAANIRYSVRAIRATETVDADDLTAAVEEFEYEDLDELLLAWRGSIEFPVWEPKDGQDEDAPVRSARNNIRRVFGSESMPASGSLEDATSAAENHEIFVLGKVERSETSEGPRNWPIRDVAPLPEELREAA